MHKNVRAALGAFAIVPALIAVGCAKPSIVGKWTGQVGPKPVNVEFKPDATVTINGEMSFMGRSFPLDSSGTYKVTDKNVAITLSSVKAQGRDVTAMVGNRLNASGTFEDDKVNLSIAGQSGTLTRVK